MIWHLDFFKIIFVWKNNGKRRRYPSSKDPCSSPGSEKHKTSNDCSHISQRNEEGFESTPLQLYTTMQTWGRLSLITTSSQTFFSSFFFLRRQGSWIIILLAHTLGTYDSVVAARYSSTSFTKADGRNERKGIPGADRSINRNVTDDTRRRVSSLWAHQKRNAAYILSPLGVVGFHQKPSSIRSSPAEKEEFKFFDVFSRNKRENS